MRLEDGALVRIGVSPSGDGDGAIFLHGRSITVASVEQHSFTSGAFPSDAVAQARLLPGDIVIALRGAANIAAMIGDDFSTGRPCFATLDVGIVRVEHPALLPDYVTAVLNLPRTQAALGRARMGDVTPRLPIGALADLEIPTPPLDLQRKVSGLFAEATEEQRLLARLVDLRQTQITELLAGSLRDAAEEPVPGGHPARALSARGDHASVP